MKVALLGVILSVAACDRRAPPAGGGDHASGAAPGEIYRVEVVRPTACVAGASCVLAVKLTALGDFHVNRDYPFKFVAKPTDGVEHQDGAFAIDSDRTGTMNVTFRAERSGTARVEGTFKLSVCSDDRCEIESAPVAIDVPIS